MTDEVVEFCHRCGVREGDFGGPPAFDQRFCWYCFDGEADSSRARELIGGAAEGRGDALRMLAAISDPRALDALREVLDHDSSEVRRAALESIGLIGVSRTVPAVTDLLRDPEEQVRCAAVAALAELGGDGATDALATALEDRTVRADAAMALAWLGDARSIPILIEAIGRADRSRNAFRTPVVALTWLGDREAVPHLIARLHELETIPGFHDELSKWAALAGPVEEIARVLLRFGGSDAEGAVEQARQVFPHLNTHVPATDSPPKPRFPGAAEERSDSRRTVPKWMLELTEDTSPITQPVTKFGGQPTWVGRPTWPLTRDNTPMTFFAQFSIPETSGRMAYLFIDPQDEENGLPLSGANALILQPGQEPSHFVETSTGPSYVSSGSDLSRFVPRQWSRLVERRVLLKEGWDPVDWDRYFSEGTETDADWNKVGGTPLFLQGPEWPEGRGWQFLFQFSAAHINHEFGDAAECFGFISDDGRGAFLWQCH